MTFEMTRIKQRLADLESNQRSLLKITDGLLKQMETTQQAILELNYTQAIREQISFNKKFDTNWDEDRVARAAHFCKTFHNHNLDPYKIQRLIKEFEETDGFNIEY